MQERFQDSRICREFFKRAQRVNKGRITGCKLCDSLTRKTRKNVLFWVKEWTHSKVTQRLLCLDPFHYLNNCSDFMILQELMFILGPISYRCKPTVTSYPLCFSKSVCLFIYILLELYYPFYWQRRISCPKGFGSISVSGQLPTYPSPNPTLILSCCQLTVVELGEG